MDTTSESKLVPETQAEEGLSARSAPPSTPSIPVAPLKQTSRLVKWLLIIFSILVFLTVMIIIGLVVLLPKTSPSEHISSQQHIASASATPTGSSPTPTQKATAKPDCGEDSVFANKEMGLSFCYPIEWGMASVKDNRISPSDTGYRQSVTFSSNSLFAVGGSSEDWSTQFGRGVGCLEPNNKIPDQSEYNTEWHDIQGSGMDVEFAMRSLVPAKGGYDITESVGQAVMSGVCVQGHKVINGSRYKVAYAAFARDFSEAAGITTAKAHMDTPNVLFTSQQRVQLDALLASIKAY